MKSCWNDRNIGFFKWGYTTYDKFIQIPASVGIVKVEEDTSPYHCFKDGDVVRITGEDSIAFKCLKDNDIQFVCKEDLILC